VACSVDFAFSSCTRQNHETKPQPEAKLSNRLPVRKRYVWYGAFLLPCFRACSFFVFFLSGSWNCESQGIVLSLHCENELCRRREKAVQSEILSGWKDIANYLGKGVRTVQRYELELGLPVRRPAGKAQGSVIATRSELDGWVAATAGFLDHPCSTNAASPVSACASLKKRIAEMEQLAVRTKKLRAELLESRDILFETLERIRGEVSQARIESAPHRGSRSSRMRWGS